jgi:outer membrane lipoprotein LolB
MTRAPGQGAAPVAARRTLLAAAVATLAGCAALAPDPGLSPASRAVEPSEWSGRFSAVYTRPGTPGEDESASGRFRLTQRDGRTLLELSTPIGQTIAQAQVEANVARLTDNQGRHYQAPSVEALTEQLFGWRVPVLRLPAWLQGRFGPSGQADSGRVWSGSEAGWDIRVEGWLDDRIVRTLHLTWPAQGVAADRRMRLRLIVDSAT